MKQTKEQYLTPEVMVLDIRVEAGFTTSLQDPFEEDPMEW